MYRIILFLNVFFFPHNLFLAGENLLELNESPTPSTFTAGQWKATACNEVSCVPAQSLNPRLKIDLFMHELEGINVKIYANSRPSIIKLTLVKYL